MKYNIQTMGCQLNENDSEKLAGMLEEIGYTHTDKLNEADVIVFNTCCVRENAEDKLFGKIGECKKYRENNGTIIAICGCMMQEPHIVEKLHESYPFVDLIFGTHTLHKFSEDLKKVIETKRKIEDILDIDGEVHEGLPIKRSSEKKASVTIMYGCNNFCAYCIVPYVRGRERCRKPEDILDEVRDLANNGYKEVTLLGQNVNSYKYGDTTFAKLLDDVDKIDGIEVIRFVSPHPKDFTDDVIDVIASSSKISKLIHLPLQAGSSEVLKSMNRRYTKEQYLELVEKMKNRIPDVSFSTDIIVGFPGETEENFEDTLDVVNKVKFEQVYMFIYSKRVGTPAAKRYNQVPEEVKHQRFNRLKALVEGLISESNKQYIGKIEQILIEGTSKNNDSVLTGRTNTNKVVIINGGTSLIGRVVNVKIISEHQWYLKGEIVY